MLQSFDNGRLIGRRSGTALPDVLALHGWARTHRDFDGVVAAIAGDAGGSDGTGDAGGSDGTGDAGGPDGTGDAGDFDGTGGPADPTLDAIALDLAGFGAAPAPPEPWGTAEYARAVAPVMVDMAPRVVVVGHSFGGRVALHLATEWPERVKALVLTGVPLLAPEDRPSPKLRFRLARSLRRAGLISEDRMEAARRRHGSTDYRNAEGIMRQVLVRTLAEDYADQLAMIRCPVTLVWGDDDTTTPLAMARVAAGRLTRPTLVVCRGAGHLTPMTVPHVLHRSARRALG